MSVVDPLQITSVAPVDESAEQLGLGLQGHLNTLRARGFIPSVVFVDPQARFRSLVQKLKYNFLES
jgi:hypothetical protein